MSSQGVRIQAKEIEIVLWFISLLGVVLTLMACSTQRPALYPNAYLNQVGTDAAELDIKECMRRADAYVSTDAGRERVLEETAMGAGAGAAVGAVAGAAGGAIVGRAGPAAAVGAAGGGAAGATRGLIRGLFSKRAPGPVYKNFVNRCLREKGYDPIGWN